MSATRPQQYDNRADQLSDIVFRRLGISPVGLAHLQRPQLVERVSRLLRANYGLIQLVCVVLADPKAVVELTGGISGEDFIHEAATQYVVTAMQLGVTTTPHFGAREGMTYLGGGLRDMQKLPLMRSHDHDGHNIRYVDYWIAQDGRVIVFYGPCAGCYISDDVNEQHDDTHIVEASRRLRNGWLIDL